MFSALYDKIFCCNAMSVDKAAEETFGQEEEKKHSSYNSRLSGLRKEPRKGISAMNVSKSEVKKSSNGKLILIKSKGSSGREN